MLKIHAANKNITFRNKPRNFESFLTLHFPKMSGKDMSELETEIIRYFQLLSNWLASEDKKLVIYSWNGANVIQQGNEIPNNSRVLEAFTEGLYM
jgi:hypothetical protein